MLILNVLLLLAGLAAIAFTARADRLQVFLCLGVVWLSIFFKLGSLPLLQPDEGRNAEVAREMMDSGAWLSPSYNGVAYLDKPAFYFKAVALSFAWFGLSE